MKAESDFTIDQNHKMILFPLDSLLTFPPLLSGVFLFGFLYFDASERKGETDSQLTEICASFLSMILPNIYRELLRVRYSARTGSPNSLVPAALCLSKFFLMPWTKINT